MSDAPEAPVTSGSVSSALDPEAAQETDANQPQSAHERLDKLEAYLEKLVAEIGRHISLRIE